MNTHHTSKTRQQLAHGRKAYHHSKENILQNPNHTPKHVPS